jgi:hypothetical protein
MTGNNNLPMNWYYAVNGQRVGPVSDQEMARVVAEGTVTAETLVWKAGMAEWRPWHEVAPTANLTPPPPPMPGGEPAAADASPAAEEPAHPEAFWAAVRQNGYAISTGGVLGRAFDLYKTHFGACLGAALVGYLLVGAAGMIPFVSLVAAFLVSPQINAGVMWNFLRRLRGEPAVIGDIFEPYSRSFGQLALMVLIQIAIALPIIVVLFVMGAGAVFASSGMTGEVAPLSGAAVLGILAMGLLLALVMWRLTLAPLFIVDRGYTAGAALLLSWRLTGLRLGSYIGLGLALILLSLAGMLAFIIGLIFVMPMLPATLAVAYESAVRAARGQASEAA